MIVVREAVGRLEAGENILECPTEDNVYGLNMVELLCS